MLGQEGAGQDREVGGPMKFGDYQKAGITYTYKVNNLADWAKKPEVQAASRLQHP